MQLTLDYDRKFDKRIPISVSGYSERDCVATKLSKPPYEYNTLMALTVDCGNQISFETSMKKSPLKYSKAFHSKVEVGYQYPIPTSGTAIGPGSFPKAHTPSVEIRNPKKLSPSFAISRQYEQAVVAHPDSLRKLPNFSDTNDRGFLISETDASGKKNNHLAEWTRKKIDKIYPRLQKRRQ
jgi:hypothetical protein